MTDDIPAEAVEAAARQLWDIWGGGQIEFHELSEMGREGWYAGARTVLRPADPHIRARVLAEVDRIAEGIMPNPTHRELMTQLRDVLGAEATDDP